MRYKYWWSASSKVRSNRIVGGVIELDIMVLRRTEARNVLYIPINPNTIHMTPNQSFLTRSPPVWYAPKLAVGRAFVLGTDSGFDSPSMLLDIA